MNHLLQLLLAGKPSEAWSDFTQVTPPSPDDLRWGGVARYQLQDFDGARDLLLRAVAVGCAPARIELATVLRHLGRLKQAREYLDELDPTDLDLVDRVFLYREFGATSYTNGDLEDACASLERSWATTFGVADGEFLRGGIAHLLALVLHAQGDSSAALKYLRGALDGPTSPSRRAYLYSTSGLVHSYLGNFREAEAAFQQAEPLAACIPTLEPVLTYNRAVLARSKGAGDAALSLLDLSAEQASCAAEKETEGYALLLKCAVHNSRGETSPARASLARAKALLNCEKASVHVLLREGALLSSIGDPKGLDLLNSSVATASSLGLLRESAWGHLHLAYCHLRRGDQDSARHHLHRAVDCRHALGSAAPLFGELNEMPELLQQLSCGQPEAYESCLYHEHRRAISSGPRSLMLQTLGAGSLVIDGEPVLIGYRHAVPILAYLMIHGPVAITRVLADVLPDIEPKRARNYFHQVRHRVQQLVPGIKIPYSTDRKYYIQSDSTLIQCDYLLAYANANSGLEGVLEAFGLYNGPFLSDQDTEWVSHAREHLHSALMRSGWRELDKPSQATNPRVLELAWRLLELDPVNIDLGRKILELHRSLDGERAARSALHRLQGHYQRELDEVPAELS